MGMANETSVDSLLEFLNRCGEKGWLNKATASALRSTAGRVGEILEPHERADVTKVDPEVAVRRFGNLNPDVSGGSLRTYISRFARAIDMFTGYRADPVNWQPPASSGSARRKPKSKDEAKKSATPKNSKSAHNESAEQMPAPHHAPASGFNYPFPLRHDVTIMISNIPRDLKTTEVSRVAAFLRSLCPDYQPEKNPADAG